MLTVILAIIAVSFVGLAAIMYRNITRQLNGLREQLDLTEATLRAELALSDVEADRLHQESARYARVSRKYIGGMLTDLLNFHKIPLVKPLTESQQFMKTALLREAPEILGVSPENATKMLEKQPPITSMAATR
jgi:hypothetical protein